MFRNPYYFLNYTPIIEQIMHNKPAKEYMKELKKCDIYFIKYSGKSSNTKRINKMLDYLNNKKIKK
jgi:hypothetical protein